MMLGREAARYDATPADVRAADGGAVTERILFMCDDKELRAQLCTLLLANDYACVLGLESLTALASSGRLSSCDVAIVDTSVAYTDAMRAFQKDGGAAPCRVIAAKSSGAATGKFPTNVDVLLSKPFDPIEIVFIIRAMLRSRVRGEPRSCESLSVGPISLHTLLNTATVADREIGLTVVETRVLEELLGNAGNPVTRDRLMRQGIGREWSPLDRTLDTHISRLRRKIGEDRRGRTPIRTLRGIGYLLLPQWEPRA